MKFITDFYAAIRQIPKKVTDNINSIRQQMIQTDIRKFFKVKRVTRSSYQRLRQQSKLRRRQLKQDGERYTESLITQYFSAIRRK